MSGKCLWVRNNLLTSLVTLELTFTSSPLWFLFRPPSLLPLPLLLCVGVKDHIQRRMHARQCYNSIQVTYFWADWALCSLLSDAIQIPPTQVSGLGTLVRGGALQKLPWHPRVWQSGLPEMLEDMEKEVNASILAGLR